MRSGVPACDRAPRYTPARRRHFTVSGFVVEGDRTLLRMIATISPRGLARRAEAISPAVESILGLPPG